MVKTNKTILVICGLAILFSTNLYGCSNEQADLESEQNDIEIVEEQYIAEEELQDSAQASLEQERIIQDQSFAVDLNEWGNAEFVSYEPEPGVELDDVSFYLVKDDQVIYEFPYYCEDNNSGNYFGLFYSVDAVGFRDLNNDGKDDVLIIISYIPGAGLEGAVPRQHARIFLAEEKGFYVAEDMMADISDHIEKKDLTVDNVYQYILSKGVENGTAEVYETGDEIEKIREYIIPEQSFDILLNDWGNVTFVSCMPMPDSEGATNPCADVSFYLIANGQVVYRFPYVNVLENDIYVKDDNIRQWGLIDSSYGGISFVMFTDVNADDKDDVIVGIFYCTGAGPQGEIPRVEVRVYEDNGDEFVYNQSLCNNLRDLPYDTTAGDVKLLLEG